MANAGVTVCTPIALQTWFPCVYDTKFIAERIANERVSFLAFMFQRW